MVLIHGEIEYLLSEPISDWSQTEENINFFWIKAKGFYSSLFSVDEEAFQKARKEKLWEKLLFLKRKEILGDFTYKFLVEVSKRRNKIHPPSKFSKEDYILFRQAKALTDAMHPIIIFDLKDAVWKKQLDHIEKHAKQLLENTKLF